MYLYSSEKTVAVFCPGEHRQGQEGGRNGVMGREGTLDLSWPDPWKVAVSCVDITMWKLPALSTPAGARALER